jgi:hypothetical protein
VSCECQRGLAHLLLLMWAATLSQGTPSWCVVAIMMSCVISGAGKSIDGPLMPAIDQISVNGPVNDPSMAIDDAIDAIDAINASFFRWTLYAK